MCRHAGGEQLRAPVVIQAMQQIMVWHMLLLRQQALRRLATRHVGGCAGRRKARLLT
jgi:hypothetical protein